MSATSSLASRIIVDLRDRSEHALVDGEHKVRNLVASDGRCSEGIAESNVLEVTDEFAG